MSIKVMTLVWDRFPASGSELLAMLALADWCSDDGGSLYPSIATLAAKIRVSESQARRLLHGFIDDGYVVVIGNANGGRAGTTRQYKVIVSKLKALPLLTPDDGETGSTDATPSMGDTPSMDATRQVIHTGGMDARDGSHGCKGTGSTHDTQTVRLTVREPSVKKPSAYPPEFEEIWSAYPKRAGNPAKSDAFLSCHARLKEGVTWADMLEGAKRYAKFCDATEKTGTEFVMQAKRFFGKKGDFAYDWTPPPKVTPRNGRPSINSGVNANVTDTVDDFFSHRTSFNYETDR